MLNNLNHECTEQSEQHFKEQLFCSLFDFSERIYQANFLQPTEKEGLSIRKWAFEMREVNSKFCLTLNFNFAGYGSGRVLVFFHEDLLRLNAYLSHYDAHPLLIKHVTKFCEQTILNLDSSMLIEKQIKGLNHYFEVHFGTITSPRSPFTLYDKDMFKEQFKRLFGKEFFIAYEKNQLEQALLKNNTREKKLSLKI